MSKIRALQWFFKQRPPPDDLSQYGASSGRVQSARKTPYYVYMHDKCRHLATHILTQICERAAQRSQIETERTKTKGSLISLPFYKSATWPIKGKISEQNQKRVLLFIALEG